jgi:hypothetical protein
MQEAHCFNAILDHQPGPVGPKVPVSDVQRSGRSAALFMSSAA